jgi:hypothetical protein
MRNHLPQTFSRIFAMWLAAGSLATGGAATAEPCNPIIDGTYCATQMPKNVGSTLSSSRMRPIDDTSRLLPTGSVSGSQPGTLVGLSFQGKGSCFGLLRRSTCN